jgi:hypothetical protein
MRTIVATTLCLKIQKGCIHLRKGSFSTKLRRLRPIAGLTVKAQLILLIQGLTAQRTMVQVQQCMVVFFLFFFSFSLIGNLCLFLGLFFSF